MDLDSKIMIGILILCVIFCTTIGFFLGSNFTLYNINSANCKKDHGIMTLVDGDYMCLEKGKH